MKVRSVNFYKRLIVFTSLSIIIVIACLLTFFIGNKLGIWNIVPIVENEESAETIVNCEKQEKTDSALKEEVTKKDDRVDDEEVTTKTAIQKENGRINQKNVYLTFDDGSSKNTTQILKILKENNIKATFFFNTSENQTSDSIIKEAYDNGHALGVLTSTDYNYDVIYSSVENYLKDFEQSYNRLYQVTGEKPSILRFPGGSINVFNKNNYKELIDQIEDKGLVYFDWNVCANDGGSRHISKELMVINATKLPYRSEKCIVLMHDNGNENICQALQEVIQFYRENGYDFEKLTLDVKPITF